MYVGIDEITLAYNICLRHVYENAIKSNRSNSAKKKGVYIQKIFISVSDAQKQLKMPGKNIAETMFCWPVSISQWPNRRYWRTLG